LAESNAQRRPYDGISDDFFFGQYVIYFIVKNCVTRPPHYVSISVDMKPELTAYFFAVRKNNRPTVKQCEDYGTEYDAILINLFFAYFLQKTLIYWVRT
jgi:hypothetical protein